MRSLRFLVHGLAVVGLSVFLMGQVGCVVTVVGAAAAGTVAYVRGELEAVVDGNTQTVAAATKAAVEEMKLAIVSHSATSIDAKTVARTADDTKIEIGVTSISDKSSKIAIRVGVFGDQALSMSILDKIKAKLPAASSTQPTTRP